MEQIDLTIIKNKILRDLDEKLQKAGLYYRIFSRTKSYYSIRAKLEKKKEDYIKESKKMQDILGIRIVMYFFEDVNIIYQILKQQSNYLEESIDTPQTNIFEPVRLNLIFRLPDEETKILYDTLNLSTQKDFAALIDNTYEIQLRTVLSEGWHEVEHDLRYKCKDELWWHYCGDDSRMLNGLYATLETAERAMSHLFRNIAYKNYKKQDWSAMIRNHFCIRLTSNRLDPFLEEIFNQNKELPKMILRINRQEFIINIFKIPIAYPLNMNNLILFANRCFIHNDELKNLETVAQPQALDKIMDALS